MIIVHAYKVAVHNFTFNFWVVIKPQSMREVYSSRVCVCVCVCVCVSLG